MREERSMTVDQLSAFCGISADVLTAIENGQARLSFPTLVRVMRAFSPSVGALVLGKHGRFSATLSSEHEKLAVMDGNVKYIPLSSGFVGGHMTPYIVEIESGVSWPDPASDMTGEYFVYLLEGNVEATMSGKQYSLGPGDSIYYDTNLSHSITNCSGKKAKLLIILD